jgi:hypothetical protein
MNDKALPIVAIVVSLAAIFVALAQKKDPLGQDEVGSSDLAQLERRLQLLESKLDAAGGQPRKLSALDNTDPVTPDKLEDGTIEQLRVRQERLEADLRRLGVLDHFKAQQEKLEKSYAAALDTTQGSKHRLTALGVLREAKRIDDTVVASMVGMWQESLADEKGTWTRWGLMENLEGVRDPDFRDSILEWLPDEESPKMRAQAIETLASMGPDQNIDQWLDYLGENDPEPKVRELATAVRNNRSGEK